MPSALTTKPLSHSRAGENVANRFVRDRRASYEQSMSVLQHAKQYKPTLMTKTSIMLGHGETDDQVMKTMQG